SVSYTHLRAHETSQDRVCRRLREKGGEDGIRDPEMSRGLGDVYKRQPPDYYALFFNKHGCFKNQVKSTKIIK
ncbi:hypothetical protein ACX3V1_08615, partial [Escherichia coli]